MAKSATLYKDSPELERGDDGVTRVRKGPKAQPAPDQEEGEADGTEGMPIDVKHAHEMGDMHARHIHERVAMHHRHQTELHHHEGDMAEVHKRHEASHKEMHDRHHAELVAMHKRHRGEHGGKE